MPSIPRMHTSLRPPLPVNTGGFGRVLLLMHTTNWPSIIILRLHLSVPVCVRVCMRTSRSWPEAIWPELKTYFSQHPWTWGITTDSPPHDWLWPQQWLKWAASKRWRGRLDWSLYLHMMAWRVQKGNILESMLPIGAFQKEVILL